ncbi:MULTISPECIES: precorrin-3B C(17)-methyltransferase [unclassified Pseudomonas]|uniref:precorrin-3B C(17)-methyltransferase n=1 Tax=unclassified Pseudomonas TaxID=196821 RepID=UPI0035BF9AD2
MTLSPAIVILGPSALATARRIQALYPQAVIHGLNGRVEANAAYDDFGDTLRGLYRSGTPVIALCAAGIVIRSLAPLLASKGAEPPVLAVAEDGSAVVPLLGGLGGVNRMAREIAASLQVSAAITTSGELRFGTCLLDPPSGYALADIDQGKRFVSDLLGGESLRIEGEAPWLDQSKLPMAEDGGRTLHITTEQRAAQAHELLIHPRTLLALIDSTDNLAARIAQAFEQAGLAQKSLAALLAPTALMTDKALADAARELNVALRFITPDTALPATIAQHDGLQVLQAQSPDAAQAIGRPRGRLSVIGLGPGAAEHMTPAVRRALDEAQDLLGYETYVRMAEPLRDDQVRHCSDNREELQRARHAFELAASGRRVVVISSGDPGVFAMAAAVLEALEEAEAPASWQTVELQVLPGVSAALATAAKAGAPLGHDFCLISLSDNLKPWTVIESRLDHAGAADLAMAFYNPISKARPWQLGRALEIVRTHRTPDTVVVLGRDIGRPAETLRVISLGELTPEMVDMRTLVIIGSSQTRRLPHGDGGEWVYTPRSYPQA